MTRSQITMNVLWLTLLGFPLNSILAKEPHSPPQPQDDLESQATFRLLDDNDSEDDLESKATFPLLADDDTAEEFIESDRSTLFYAGFGASFWGRLEDLQPRDAFDTSEGFGSFDRWGAGFVMGFQKRVYEGDASNLWLGAEFGLFSHAERKDFRVRLPRGEVIDDDATVDTLYFAANVSWRRDLGVIDFVLGGGIGLYQFRVTEESDRNFRLEDVVVEDTDLGGYVSVGFEYAISEEFTLTLEDKIHAFHFDDLRRFTPGRDSIDGPVHFIQLGFQFRF